MVRALCGTYSWNNAHAHAHAHAHMDAQLSMDVYLGQRRRVRCFSADERAPLLQTAHPITQAARRGDLAEVRQLVRVCGVDPRVEGHAPVRAAAAHGHLHVVRWLVEGNRARGGGGHAALVQAVEAGHLHIVRYLCTLPASFGIVPQTRRCECLRVAIAHGRVDVVKYLCGLDGSPASMAAGVRDWHAFAVAARDGHVATIRYLCSLDPQRGVRPGANGSVALAWAAKKGRVAVVAWLCDLPPSRGVRVDTDENFVFRMAAEGGSLEVVQYLCRLPRARGVDATTSRSCWPLPKATSMSWCTWWSTCVPEASTRVRAAMRRTTRRCGGDMPRLRSTCRRGATARARWAGGSDKRRHAAACSRCV